MNNYISNEKIEQEYLEWFFENKKRTVSLIKPSCFISKLEKKYQNEYANIRTSINYWKLSNSKRFIKIQRDLYIDTILQNEITIYFTSEVFFRNDSSLFRAFRINDSKYNTYKGKIISSNPFSKNSKYEKKLNKTTKKLFQLLYLVKKYDSLKQILNDLKTYLIKTNIWNSNIKNKESLIKAINKKINLIYSQGEL